MALLEADIRSFSYPQGNRPALRNIRLSVDRGEFVVILGSAGAGKTTLCYCLTGVVPHHVEGSLDGEVRINGRPLNRMRLPEIATQVGFVLQSPENQLFSLTVYDDVSFGPENLCLPVDEVRRRAMEALTFVGLLSCAARNPDTLSGGQAQRAVLASILAMPSQIYVLDQPTAELDPLGRRQVYESIAKLNRAAGRTIILVEDRLEEIVETATRMILLHGGSLIYDDPPSVFLGRRDLEDYGIRLPTFLRLHRVGAPDGDTDASREALGQAGAAWPLRAGFLAGEGHWQDGHVQGLASPWTGRELLVELENVHFRYPGGTEALRGVTFRAGAGELVAILGENGAGKTTLAKHIIGLLRPTSGTVKVAGEDTRKKSVAKISRTVGFLFQDPDYQIFSVSAFDEVAFGLRLRGLAEEEVRARATAALERVGLGPYADLHPYRLSRGQRQKLALASVLALEPRVLVVDEPSTGLDYRETQQVMGILREYAQTNLVIMVTHDVEMALRYATRAVVMAAGKVVFDGAIEQFAEDADLLRRAGMEAHSFEGKDGPIAEGVSGDLEDRISDEDAALQKGGEGS